MVEGEEKLKTAVIKCIMDGGIKMSFYGIKYDANVLRAPFFSSTRSSTM